MQKDNSNKIFALKTTLSVVLILLGILFIGFPDKMQHAVVALLAVIFFGYAALFFVRYLKIRTVAAVIETAVFALLAVALIVLSVVFKGNHDVTAIIMGIYCLLKGIRNVVFALRGHLKTRNKFVYIINTLTYFILFVAILRSVIMQTAALQEFLVIYGIVYIAEGAIALYSAITERHGALIKILDKTYAKEILSGLLFAMITASFLLVYIEPQISSFGDGIWYCFALITTIGFGDIAATTSLGRIISVVIGIYGIIVVALITSIIVNMYIEKTNEDKDSE